MNSYFCKYAGKTVIIAALTPQSALAQAAKELGLPMHQAHHIGVAFVTPVKKLPKSLDKLLVRGA